MARHLQSGCGRTAGRGPQFDSRSALVLLLTTMKTALEERYPDRDEG